MSAIELTIIGILMEKERNAYDIAQFVSCSGVNQMIKISAPSIYVKCKRLHETGYLDGVTVREGEMPEKTVYGVNDKGRAHFTALMAKYADSVSPFFFNFNAVILHLDKVSPAEGMALLDSLERALTQFASGIAMHEEQTRDTAPFAAQMIIRQYRMILATLVQWVGETKSAYQSHIKQ